LDKYKLLEAGLGMALPTGGDLTEEWDRTGDVACKEKDLEDVDPKDIWPSPQSKDLSRLNSLSKLSRTLMDCL
jgi:hypothetical protein